MAVLRCAGYKFFNSHGPDANLSCCHKHNSRDHTVCFGARNRERARYRADRSERTSNCEKGIGRLTAAVVAGVGEYEEEKEDEDGGGSDGGADTAVRRSITTPPKQCHILHNNIIYITLFTQLCEGEEISSSRT